MTTIKNPQTISHKNNSCHGSHRFILVLILLTWGVVGSLFYGVKNGSIQPNEVNPELAAKISALESSISAMDVKLKSLEEKLATVSLPTQPIDTVVTPEALSTPEAPSKAEDIKQPETGAAPATDPIMSEPKEAQPETPATKPQTQNIDKSNSTDQTSLAEKKSYL